MTKSPRRVAPRQLTAKRPRKAPAKKKASAPSMKAFLHSAAHGAGAILMRYLHRTHTIERKDRAGIVTEADKAAEAYLLKEISRNFPQSSIITEESGEFQGSSLCFIIDPLDGTTNYAHGFPWFCVSIGAYEGDRPVAGIIYQPVNGELFYAEAGKGATLNGKRIRASTTAKLEDALLGTGFYYSTGDRLREELEVFRRIQEKALGVRRPGSAALDLAYVACGRYDGFWERGLSSWDVAAGLLLVTEAGGQISGYAGGPTSVHDREVVATNGHLHQDVLSLIRG